MLGGAVLLIAVFLLCTIIFLFLSRLLGTTLFGSHSFITARQISNYVVSALQAITAFFVGCAIINKTSSDVLYARHWWTDWYPWAAFGYGLYDLFSMRYVYGLKRPHSSLLDFVRGRMSVVVHHLWLMIFAFPIVLWLRKEKGDFFIGCTFMFECSSPFILLRAILSELKMKQSRLYVANGLAMIMSFFLSRIVIFPFMFWSYAKYANISFGSVPFVLPRICMVGCATLLSLQIYWFSYMIYGAKRVLCNRDFEGVDCDYEMVSKMKSQ